MTASWKSSAARWLVIAASSRSASLQFAASLGIDPTLVLTGPELIGHSCRLRALLRSHQIDGAVLHSTAWSREVYPHVYELFLALAPVRCRYLADGESGSIRPVSRADLCRRMLRVPGEVAAGVGLVGAEVIREGLARAHSSAPGSKSNIRSADGKAVLVIWRRPTGDEVGGATTHLSGILGAFRRAGFQIGLVTPTAPPEQLLAVVDDVEVPRPLEPGTRLTHDLNEIASDRPLKEAGMRLARRLGPSFVYQRHTSFLLAGTRVARACGVPLILEWNASAVWTRMRWEPHLPIERILTPLAVSWERQAAKAADLVVAVSESAAQMALRMGAPAERVLIVPNGVDVEKVRPAPEGEGRRQFDGPVLGWVGSFGPWHGAEVLVRALSLLPGEIRLVMVGDGARRAACQSLARSLGVEDRILWVGAVPHGTALDYLRSCDILVSPHVPLPDTPFFGSPTKLFEYMALGKPIVASRLEQLGEILEDGRTARLVQPGDAEALRDGILDVLRTPDRGRRLGQEARWRAEHRHTWGHRAAAILDRLETGVSGAPTITT